jgi:hypothetical protein
VPTALYYPYSQISNESLIRSALLLWDKIEYITPGVGHASRMIADGPYREALELIGRPHRPTQEEQQIAHNKLEALLNEGLPDSFSLVASNSHEDDDRYGRYHIYGAKLLHQTWHMLMDRGLAEVDPAANEFGVSRPLGLLAMSLLAESCAGATRLRVTDQPEAYAWLDEELTRSLGGKYVRGLDPSQVAGDYDRLITLSVRVLNADEIPIDRLLAMRQRETSKSDGGDYRKLRQRYFAAIREHVGRLAKAKTQRDARELERQFQEEMRSDLRDLKSELRLNNVKTLLSKEVGVAALAVAGAIVEPFSGITGVSAIGSAIGVGALVNLKNQFRASRKKLLESHSMSWLYSLPRAPLLHRLRGWHRRD